MKTKTSISDALRILNLPSNYTLESLKQTYRNLSKIYHPDISSTKSNSDKFIKITEAYNILKENFKSTGRHSRAKSSNSTNGNSTNGNSTSSTNSSSHTSQNRTEQYDSKKKKASNPEAELKQKLKQEFLELWRISYRLAEQTESGLWLDTCIRSFVQKHKKPPLIEWFKRAETGGKRIGISRKKKFLKFLKKIAPNHPNQNVRNHWALQYYEFEFCEKPDFQ